jgi:hypothetical protein
MLGAIQEILDELDMADDVFVKYSTDTDEDQCSIFDLTGDRVCVANIAAAVRIHAGAVPTMKSIRQYARSDR